MGLVRFPNGVGEPDKSEVAGCVCVGGLVEERKSDKDEEKGEDHEELV